jgi:hypothetical protein
MKKGVSILTIILISIIVILLAILAYGLYTGFRVKAMINSLTLEKNNLTNQLSALQEKYNLLQQDVANIYKTCLRDNACKGRFPNVSWYCNNVGDEADLSNASHICVCDSKCDLNLTAINQPSSGY